MKLDDFLKVEKVRCVKAYGDCLTVGKAYGVIDIRMEVKVKDDEGDNYYWESDHFEPVLDSAENPLQGVELTPEFEAVEPVLADNCQVNTQDNSVNIQDTPKFEVGDKVYYPSFSHEICIIRLGVSDDLITLPNDDTILAAIGTDLGFSYNDKEKIWEWGCEKSAPAICHATPENYTLLTQLYPHIEFEQPPKPLTGSDLARAMLEKGWHLVPCVVSDVSDSDALNNDNCCLVDEWCVNYFDSDGYRYKYAVPFDPRTGEPLTESILND